MVSHPQVSQSSSTCNATILNRLCQWAPHTSWWYASLAGPALNRYTCGSGGMPCDEAACCVRLWWQVDLLHAVYAVPNSVLAVAQTVHAWDWCRRHVVLTSAHAPKPAVRTCECRFGFRCTQTREDPGSLCSAESVAQCVPCDKRATHLLHSHQALSDFEERRAFWLM